MIENLFSVHPNEIIIRSILNFMNYSFLSETIELIGHLLIAYTVIMVHYRFRKEHRIDQRVFLAMRREQVVGIIGVVFMLTGYFLKVAFV